MVFGRFYYYYVVYFEMQTLNQFQLFLNFPVKLFNLYGCDVRTSYTPHACIQFTFLAFCHMTVCISQSQTTCVLYGWFYFTILWMCGRLLTRSLAHAYSFSTEGVAWSLSQQRISLYRARSLRFPRPSLFSHIYALYRYDSRIIR